MDGAEGADVVAHASDVQTTVFHAPLHIFRAVAIVLIVAAHTWSFPIAFGGGEDPSTSLRVLDAGFEMIFHDSTIFFTLISGLLFTLVLRQRSWQRFFSGKLRTVAIPYVVVTVLYSTLRFGSETGGELADITRGDYWTNLVRDILTGGAAIHLWYIPVLGLLFLATPVLTMALGSAHERWVYGFLVGLPLVASRTFPETGLRTPLYFLGAYAAGMYIGDNYHAALTAIRSKQRMLIAITVVASVVAFVMLLNDVHWVGPVSVRESTLYVQKMAAGGLLLVALQRFETIEELPRLVGRLADSSFAIYFFHIYPINVATHLVLDWFDPPQPTWFIALFGLVQLVAILALLVVGAEALKRVLGPRSRLLIGS